MPVAEQEDVQEQSRYDFSVYLRPWTLAKKLATQIVPYLAELRKDTTEVTAPTESGEPDRPPKGEPDAKEAHNNITFEPKQNA